MLIIGGLFAEIIRAQLASPNGTLVSLAQYNELFTMHGSVMIYLFAGPFAFGGLANIIVPIQIGAPDMAFPRLNALSYWLYLMGSITMLMGFFTAGGAANFGWVAYAPLSNSINTPGAGADLWIGGLLLTGFSAIFTGVNLTATIFYLRAPGMTMFRMPIFTWNMLVTAILILLGLPGPDRRASSCSTATDTSGPISSPLLEEVFRCCGNTSSGSGAIRRSIFWPCRSSAWRPRSSRSSPSKPVFGYKSMVFATLSIGALSLGVWAHHMFTTGVVLLPFFSFMSLMIAVPTGIKIFNWIGTMWRGELWFSTAMLMALGFLITFLIGGITGIYLASPPLDFFTHDTYFVVAHFHSIVMALVLAGMGGLYYWGPKFTGLHAEREVRQDPVLVPLHRHPGLHVPAVHPRTRRHAAAHRDLSALAAVEDPQ